MNATAAFIANLRHKGVRLYREGAQLVVEAPHGVITPEVRAELSRAKRQLLKSLSTGSSAAKDEDPIATKAARAIARLLASAYLRERENCGRVDHNGGRRSGELALSEEPSVHGVVP